MNTDNFLKKVGELAKSALIDEVTAYPKPGLVDSQNNGAHSDMSIDTFVKSAEALEEYFYRFAKYGKDTSSVGEKESFPNGRLIGVEAERAMFNATGGVNTHKGIIFSMGLICMAVGRLYALGKKISIHNICSTVSLTVSGICERDLQEIKSATFESDFLTNGEKIYTLYGIKGPRGEAESGFKTVREYSYPFMKECFEKGIEKNEVLVRTLLFLMSVVTDTNVINRGGKEAGKYVKDRSKTLYMAPLSEIEEFDKELIQKNLSPGGSADLLAVTWFIYSLEKIFN